MDMDTTRKSALSAASTSSEAEALASKKITDQYVRSVVEDFRIQRAKKGVVAADEEFFMPVLQRWHELLNESSSTSASGRREFLVKLTVCMHESMGMRDSIILSVVSSLEERDLLRVGVRPNDPATAQVVSSTLSSIFRISSACPDKQRCQRALDALVEIHTLIPRSYGVQPLAVLSYLLWWSGREEEAQGAALRSLSIDGECTLAAIVLSAVEYGIAPAWVESARKDEK